MLMLKNRAKKLNDIKEDRWKGQTIATYLFPIYFKIRGNIKSFKSFLA